jgi:putative transposase
MGQSLVKNYMHIVFSTKNRQSLILPLFETSLHSYIAGICNNLECYPIKIGGYTDHVHVLCLLSKKITLAKFAGELKAHLSRWMKTIDKGLDNFYWQDGYGAFSVNPTEIDVVKVYIENQHHQEITFQDEYRAFLKKYQVEYDERYVWD